MFNRLKEKLKSSLGIFSKKVEEEKEEVKKEEVKKEIKEKEKVKKEEEKEVREEEKKKGVVEKVKEKIVTRKISEEKFDELFWVLEKGLLENNVSVEVIEKIKEDLKEELVDKPLPRNVLKKIEETLRKSLEGILEIEKVDLVARVKAKKPCVMAFFGINGSGKTTTIAKIVKLLQINKLTAVLAAGDTFRAASIEQLEEWGKKLGVKVIKQKYGADAAAVAFDAVKYAEKHKVDAVLIDTAGRLHSDVNLMEELKKICRVVKPDIKIFVGESIVGNDCVEQVKRFDGEMGMDMMILTKADVDEKGGAAISVSYIVKKPIVYFGVGQELGDLEEFDKEKVLRGIF